MKISRNDLQNKVIGIDIIEPQPFFEYWSSVGLLEVLNRLLVEIIFNLTMRHDIAMPEIQPWRTKFVAYKVCSGGAVC